MSEASKLAHRRYRQNNPERSMWFRARKRASNTGLDFTIEVTDIVIPSVCPILGIPVFQNPNPTSRGGACENSPALDRIDNTKGYVKGNVHVISSRANRIKADASLHELKNLVNYLEQLENNPGLGEMARRISSF